MINDTNLNYGDCDMEYELALAIAQKAHAKQVDKSGVPYIQHCLAVSNGCHTREGKIAGLLHDVLEDTDMTRRDLEEAGIETIICDIVELVTKTQPYNEKAYFKRIKENPIAREVKIADLRHNSDLSRLKNITEKDLRRNQKYQKELKYLLD